MKFFIISVLICIPALTIAQNTFAESTLRSQVNSHSNGKLKMESFKVVQKDTVNFGELILATMKFEAQILVNEDCWRKFHTGESIFESFAVVSNANMNNEIATSITEETMPGWVKKVFLPAEARLTIFGDMTCQREPHNDWNECGVDVRKVGLPPGIKIDDGSSNESNTATVNTVVDTMNDRQTMVGKWMYTDKSMLEIIEVDGALGIVLPSNPNEYIPVVKKDGWYGFYDFGIWNYVNLDINNDLSCLGKIYKAYEGELEVKDFKDEASAKTREQTKLCGIWSQRASVNQEINLKILDVIGDGTVTAFVKFPDMKGDTCVGWYEYKGSKIFVTIPSKFPKMNQSGEIKLKHFISEGSSFLAGKWLSDDGEKRKRVSLERISKVP